MSIIGILKIMEVQEDDMEVQEEAVLNFLKFFYLVLVGWMGLKGPRESKIRLKRLKVHDRKAKRPEAA